MKLPLFKLTRIRAAIGFVVVIMVVAAGIIYVHHDKSHADAVSKSSTTKTIPSQFSFGSANGWYKGPANATSLALFSDDHACFTSMEYKTGTADVTANIQKQQASLSGGGTTMTPGATVSMTLTANGVPASYDLHQFSLAGGGEALMDGLELGYAQLEKGYVEVQGHCNRADQLPTTVAALQAYSFKSAQ